MRCKLHPFSLRVCLFVDYAVEIRYTRLCINIRHFLFLKVTDSERLPSNGTINLYTHTTSYKTDAYNKQPLRSHTVSHISDVKKILHSYSIVFCANMKHSFFPFPLAANFDNFSKARNLNSGTETVHFLGSRKYCCVCKIY